MGGRWREGKKKIGGEGGRERESEGKKKTGERERERGREREAERERERERERAQSILLPPVDCFAMDCNNNWSVIMS